MNDTRIIATGLLFPEAPRWHAGKLWFSDIHDRRVKTCTLGGELATVVEMPAPNRCSGLGFLPDGALLIVASPHKIMRFDARGLTMVADVSQLVAHGCNDMVVDANGNAYIGNLGYDFRAATPVPATAPLLLVKPDGTASIAAQGLGFPNGSVITPDGKTLIVGETFASRYTAFDIAPDGTLSNRRIWVQFDTLGFTLDQQDGRVLPDGCCLDAEGAIWLASPGIDQVLRVRPDGRITHRIKPSQAPYACMLGGPDRQTLFVLTAKTHHLPEVITARSGRVEIASVGVPGAGIP